MYKTKGVYWRGPVEMPVYFSELVSVFVVFWCYMCISAIEHKVKSVVFSYASASHPHVATLSHHYRAPPDPEPQLQQYLPPSNQYSQHYVPPSAVQTSYLPHSAAQNIPPALPSSDGQSYHPELYPENVHLQDGQSQNNDGMSHYDDRTSGIYQNPIGSPTPLYEYDYTTISPNAPSTVVYHNHLPLDNHNYNPYSTSTAEPPFYYEHDTLNDLSSVPPDLGYQSTPIYYNDRPPDDSPNIQPPSYERPQGHDHSSTGLTHPTETYHGVLQNDYHHSLPTQSQHNQEQNFHGYTTPLPVYHNNNSPTHYETPQNFPMMEHPQPESNLTHPPRSHHNYNSDGPLNQNFPDYQAPASPEYFDSSSFHPPRGGKTFSPLPSSSTQVYYEDENEYISTTPIIEFESVKEKLPAIEDYPSPKPSYITKPFKNPFNQKKSMERQEHNKRRPSKASDKSSMLHHTNDKVLQKPKYFAYSTDLLDDHGGTDGLIDQGNQSDENSEDDDHEQKKKDEKYSKGGGQEHHSGHKATAGDKGDKGYKSGHKHEEGKKGHHEKEDHKGKYVDEKGKKGKKEEEAGHYGENHKAEKGKKAAKYGESGEHKKGHSTKGEHNIHKLDEYMKKHEFYDEHHEGGDHEKFGGFMEAHTHKKGGKKKKGHHKGGHHQKHKGKKGHHEKGHKLGHHKGHKDAKGYDGHFSKHKKYGKKGSTKKGKKWGYSKGHPPK